MRMTASWSGSKRTYRIQVCGATSAPNGELPSDPQQTDRQQPDTEAMQKALSQFIVAPRAQASKPAPAKAGGAAKHKRR
jgi:hypothetical protein